MKGNGKDKGVASVPMDLTLSGGALGKHSARGTSPRCETEAGCARSPKGGLWFCSRHLVRGQGPPPTCPAFWSSQQLRIVGLRKRALELLRTVF